MQGLDANVKHIAGCRVVSNAHVDVVLGQLSIKRSII